MYFLFIIINMFCLLSYFNVSEFWFFNNIGQEFILHILCFYTYFYYLLSFLIYNVDYKPSFEKKKKEEKPNKKNAGFTKLSAKKGVCIKIFLRTPKKPNSALR